jgi:hypothetical protein
MVKKKQIDDLEDMTFLDDTPEQNRLPVSKNYDFDDLGDSPIESDNSRWEMDADDVFNVVERSLRGQAISKDGSKYIKVAEPLCNEFGISHIMRYLRSHVNKNFILSNFTKQDINAMMTRLMRGFIKLLKSNYKEFDIQDKWQLDEIVSIFENNVFATFKRAEGGIERKIRRDKYRLTESVNGNSQSSGFNPFAFFGGGNSNDKKPPQNYNEVNI